MLWRSMRPWAVLVSASGGGTAAALIGAAWLPSWGAAMVAASGAALAGGFTADAQRAISERRLARQSVAGSMNASTRRAVRHLVREVNDPIALGVHPAARHGAPSGTERLPQFVRRDCFPTLLDRLRLGGLVLIVGESTAGKSRLAYEAMRAALPDHTAFLLKPGHDLEAVAAEAANVRQCLVWFDEFDQFLGVGGLTTDLVRAMLDGTDRHVVLLASMRSKEYDRYSARQREVTDAATWRSGREVLLMAADPLHLERLWTRAEVERARSAAADPRVAQAARGVDNRFGVAELLAAGPELVNDWLHAWQPGTHPRGAALVSAAIDCRRMGLHHPVDRDLLLALHSHYLTERGGSILRPEPVEEAFTWATSPVQGASSLLVPQTGGFMAFDYLIDLPELASVPESSWLTLLDRTSPEDSVDIGWAAVDLMRPLIALSAFDAARRHGLADADYAHAIALGNAGRPAEAVQRLRALLEERREALGGDHPHTMNTRHDIARYLAEAGHPDQAVGMLLRVIDDRARLLGPRHEQTLAARAARARFTSDAGDHESALSQFASVLATMEEVLGPEHLEVWLTRQDLARALGRAGHIEEALALNRRIYAALVDTLGAAHPWVLSSRYEEAVLTGQSGRSAEAVDLLRVVMADQQRVLGTHSRTLSTRHQLGKFLAADGHLEEGLGHLDTVIADQNRFHGPDHPRTLASCRERASIRETLAQRANGS
ncbi:tetratricopeptide repeat protein [Streptomyces sp. NPDC029004]|uniref:tetratricopeptide repeat protein n=1 Tax=Streptomyces sp. NPDC029004 TaxID=3154490 RepID=UPI0033F6D3EB